jgi:hypothetical protein
MKSMANISVWRKYQSIAWRNERKKCQLNHRQRRREEISSKMAKRHEQASAKAASQHG